MLAVTAILVSFANYILLTKLNLYAANQRTHNAIHLSVTILNLTNIIFLLTLLALAISKHRSLIISGSAVIGTLLLLSAVFLNGMHPALLPHHFFLLGIKFVGLVLIFVAFLLKFAEKQDKSESLLCPNPLQFWMFTITTFIFMLSSTLTGVAAQLSADELVHFASMVLLMSALYFLSVDEKYGRRLLLMIVLLLSLYYLISTPLVLKSMHLANPFVAAAAQINIYRFIGAVILGVLTLNVYYLSPNLLRTLTVGLTLVIWSALQISIETIGAKTFQWQIEDTPSKQI
jgi:hypothetical protein